MKHRFAILLSFMGGAGMILDAYAGAGRPSLSASLPDGLTWPYSVPCRIRDGCNPEFFIMVLDQLRTPLARGVGIGEGNESDRGSVEFIVVGDGTELWRSGTMRKADRGRRLSISVRWICRLLLRVENAGVGIDYDHAGRADA